MNQEKQEKNHVIFDSLRNKVGPIKHLAENNMTYRAHWWRAMSMSVALFIHAWIPSLFQTYASDKMKQNHSVTS